MILSVSRAWCFSAFKYQNRDISFNSNAALAQFAYFEFVIVFICTFVLCTVLLSETKRQLPDLRVFLISQLFSFAQKSHQCLWLEFQKRCLELSSDLSRLHSKDLNIISNISNQIYPNPDVTDFILP